MRLTFSVVESYLAKHLYLVAKIFYFYIEV